MEVTLSPNIVTTSDLALITLFYKNRLHVTDKHVHENESMLSLSKEVLDVLIKLPMTDLLSMIESMHTPWVIKASDIPQFSSIEDCAYQTPHLIIASQLEDISYGQMGYLLRTEPRTDVADLKYGENHAKVAAQMGLCVIYKHKIYPSCLGVTFDKLPQASKKNLLPKLILLIPFIQQIFSCRMTSSQVDESLGMLSATTRKRRLPNVWTLVSIVNEQLPYELQIYRY